ADKPELQEWTNWEQRWYTDFAQPLIQGRKEVDAGHSTFANLQVLYLQRNTNRETWGRHSFNLKSGEEITFVITPKSRIGVVTENFVRQVAVHVVIAVVICITGLLVALFGLRALNRTVTSTD